MNKDRPWQGQAFQTEERIVGKENPAFLTDMKIAQAMAAGAVPGGNLGVSRMSVAGRLHGRSDKLGNFCRDRDYAVGDYLFHIQDSASAERSAAIRSLRSKRGNFLSADSADFLENRVADGFTSFALAS